jgi:hypothetical protein
MGSEVGKETLVAERGIGATAVTEDDDGKRAVCTGGFEQLLGTVNGKVREACLTDGDGLERAGAAAVYDLGLDDLGVGGGDGQQRGNSD